SDRLAQHLEHHPSETVGGVIAHLLREVGRPDKVGEEERDDIRPRHCAYPPALVNGSRHSGRNEGTTSALSARAFMSAPFPSPVESSSHREKFISMTSVTLCVEAALCVVARPT